MSELSPAEQVKRRTYFAEATRQRRERLKKEKICPTCGKNAAKPDGVTCSVCDEVALERDRLNGFPARPSRLVVRAGKRIIRAGGKVTITQVAEETGCDKGFVREVLLRFGLWEARG
jgi:hypothetical protein